MKLKVISFNIRCMDDKDGHSVKERAPRLRKVIDVLVDGKFPSDHYGIYSEIEL